MNAQQRASTLKCSLPISIVIQSQLSARALDMHHSLLQACLCLWCVTPGKVIIPIPFFKKIPFSANTHGTQLLQALKSQQCIEVGPKMPNLGDLVCDITSMSRTRRCGNAKSFCQSMATQKTSRSAGCALDNVHCSGSLARIFAGSLLLLAKRACQDATPKGTADALHALARCLQGPE